VSRRSKRWDRLRAGLDLILDQRGAEMADVPGGASGLLVRDYKGKEASRCLTVRLVGQALPTLVHNGVYASAAGGHTSTTAKATRTVRSGIGSATTC
jgi:hypothetical protein